MPESVVDNVVNTVDRERRERAMAGVTCARCGEHRWPSTPVEPYLCQRCGMVLTGEKNVIDPCGSEATRDAWAKTAPAQLQALVQALIQVKARRVATVTENPTRNPVEPSAETDQGGNSGSPGIASDPATPAGTCGTVFRDGRAGRPGRPRVAAWVQRRKAAERARKYREGQRRAAIERNEAAFAGASS